MNVNEVIDDQYSVEQWMDLNWKPFVINHSFEGFYSLELRGLSIVFRRIGYWLGKLYSCFYIWTNLLVTLAMEFNSLLEIGHHLIEETSCPKRERAVPRFLINSRFIHLI